MTSFYVIWWGEKTQSSESMWWSFVFCTIYMSLMEILIENNFERFVCEV